jgi:NDP-sugar pyrophosphorylase family protein
VKAVILAGGRGTRLRPYTLVLPKPLVPIGDRPVVELLIQRLKKFGLEEIIITIGYFGDLIRAFCGDGSKWGMNITYSEEKEPLGTIGPLTLIEDQLKETFLVCNGDIITDLNIFKFIDIHKERGGIATVATTKRKVKIDLGVLACDDERRVASFMEKPENEFLASLGIYLFEPQLFDYVPKNVPFGFDDLMNTLISQDVPVYTYLHNGYWLDIGIEEDFKKAQREFEENRERILGD